MRPARPGKTGLIRRETVQTRNDHAGAGTGACAGGRGRWWCGDTPQTVAQVRILPRARLAGTPRSPWPAKSPGCHGVVADGHYEVAGDPRALRRPDAIAQTIIWPCNI